MRTLVRTAVVMALTVVVGAGAAGVASAQPAPPPVPTDPPAAAPPLTPEDQAAQYACLQRELDFTTLPQDAITAPAAFSAKVAAAAQKCKDVRA